MDKMGNEKYLSKEETEKLCRLYMDCRLSLLEETELHYVLGFLPYSSPIIDEARTLMNISLSCGIGKKEEGLNNFHERGKSLKRRILLIAASVVLLLSIGIPTFMYFNRQPDYYCQVFTNGKKVSRDKALIIAEGELERIDRFFENMNNYESEQQKKLESFYNNN